MLVIAGKLGVPSAIVFVGYREGVPKGVASVFLVAALQVFVSEFKLLLACFGSGGIGCSIPLFVLLDLAVEVFPCDASRSVLFSLSDRISFRPGVIIFKERSSLGKSSTNRFTPALGPFMRKVQVVW